MPDNLQGQALELRDATRTFLGEHLIGRDPDRATVIAAARDAGLYGLTQTRAMGGQQADELCLTVVREELAAANHPATRLVLGPGPGVLGSVTSGPLHDHYLKGLMAGQLRSAFAFTEPPDQPPTHARIEADELIVNGVKSYVTGGSDADFLSTLVHIEGEPGGAAFVIIDTDQPGVQISEPFHSLDGSQHVAITFADVRVPRQHMVGQPGEGLPRAMRQIGNVRLAVAAEACGLARWTLEFIESHLQAPHRSGAPLGDREGVRLRYADLRIRAYAARSALYRTARLAAGGANVVNETIATKVFATEVIGQIVDEGIQLAGGNALVDSHPLATLYRRVRSFRLVEGASDVLRLNLARGRLDLDLGRI